MFFKRDCAVGGGPAVDAPRAGPPAPVVPVVAPAVAVAVEVVVPEVVVVAGVVPAVVVAVMLGWDVAVDSAGFPKSPPAVAG